MMSEAAANRTWVNGPKSYLMANRETLWEKPSDSGSSDIMQGAIFGRRSDEVVCFSVYEVPKEATAIAVQEAINRATAKLQTMLNCPCTPDKDCPAHSGSSGRPKAVRPGGVLPRA